jgi:hypothetical protein
VPANALRIRTPAEARRIVRRRPAAPAEETLTVKLATADPDVVIYWLFEKRGD